jgi:cytochrome c biogenesis protein CcmG/thiol:disulfide interchange protein DsbE
VNVPLLVIGLAVVAPLIVLLAVSFGRDPRAVPNALVDKPAPVFSLQSLEGEEVSLAGLEGRPVVLNFWSTWCVPCKVEHPVLQLAATRYEDVAFYGVLYSDEPVKAKGYLKRAGAAYPTLVDPGGKMAVDYGVAGVPETYFIDEKGVITYKQVGPVSWDLLATVLGAP